jgi:hypothetical protein
MIQGRPKPVLSPPLANPADQCPTDRYPPSSPQYLSSAPASWTLLSALAASLSWPFASSGPPGEATVLLDSRRWRLLSAMDHGAVHALWSSWHGIPFLQALAAVRVRWNASGARARMQGAGYRAPVSFLVADCICTWRSAEGCAREPAATLFCRASRSARVARPSSAE